MSDANAAPACELDCDCRAYGRLLSGFDAMQSERDAAIERAKKAEAAASPTAFVALAQMAQEYDAAVAQRDALDAMLEIILPMAKGYAAEHRVGRNLEIVVAAEETLRSVRSNAGRQLDQD